MHFAGMMDVLEPRFDDFIRKHHIVNFLFEFAIGLFFIC